MTVLELAQRQIAGLKKKTAKEWAGPCPACGGEDRFMVWTHRDRWHCRGCGKSGDAVAFLREFAGYSCPEAYAAVGRECDSSDCPALDRCRKGGQGARPKPAAKPLSAPAAGKEAPTYAPAAAIAPAELWRQQAEKLIERAHAALLACPEQLDYLAARGLPLAAVERYRLGWLGEDNYRPRSAWGLPEILRESDGKPKKLWIPLGIVIPFFAANGAPFRIRIRRPKIQEGECRYYWIPGSGDDVPVINPSARAFVVVESDLDGYLVAWHAGDLTGAIPLGTCSAKPKEAAMAALRSALTILVSLDHEPRENAKTGKPENPGGSSSRWWCEHFPRAKRWPTPAGKDPGEYFSDHGGDIRAWVLNGLPPVFHIPTARPAAVDIHPSPSSSTSQVHAPALGRIYAGATPDGQPLHIAELPDDALRLATEHPGATIFLESEILAIKAAGYSKAEAADILALRRAFPFSGAALEIKPLVGSGLAPQPPSAYDPSRQRRAQQGRA